jgi:hypothetical protein
MKAANAAPSVTISLDARTPSRTVKCSATFTWAVAILRSVQLKPILALVGVGQQIDFLPPGNVSRR